MPRGPLVSHPWVTGLVRTLQVIRGDMPTLALASLSKRGDLWSGLAGFGSLHSVVRNRCLQAQFCFSTGLLFLFYSWAISWVACYASNSVIQKVMSVLFLLLLLKKCPRIIIPPGWAPMWCDQSGSQGVASDCLALVGDCLSGPGLGILGLLVLWIEGQFCRGSENI